MKRVMIFGGAGAGKSTLARKLGEATSLPVIHIDHIHWQSGWVKRDHDEVRALISKKIKADEWIFDGRFALSSAHRLARADTVIYLDMPTWLRVLRVIKRTFTSFGKIRLGSAHGCPERFDWKYLKWVAQYEQRGDRTKALAFLKVIPVGIDVFHFKSRNQVSRYVTMLKKNKAND